MGAVRNLCEMAQPPALAELGGPQTWTLETLLLAYRNMLHLPAAPVIRLPAGMVARPPGVWSMCRHPH
jgi:hypothetical protein